MEQSPRHKPLTVLNFCPWDKTAAGVKGNFSMGESFKGRRGLLDRDKKESQDGCS